MSNRKDRSKWWNIERALALVATLDADACWIWPGARWKSGYGQVYHSGKQRRAHRVAYERLIGPIPEGLEPDHVCRNRACFNPRHLDVVTHKMNSLRGEGVPAKNARKTQCAHGHLFDADNTRHYRRPNGTMMRVCRTCVRLDTWHRRGKLAVSHRSPSESARAPSMPEREAPIPST